MCSKHASAQTDAAAQVDRELEKRRQRAAAWQAQKATNQELIEAEAKAREHAEKGAKWSFEEESDEEEALHPVANGTPAGDAGDISCDVIDQQHTETRGVDGFPFYTCW